MCLCLVRLNEVVCHGLLLTVAVSLITTTQIWGQAAKPTGANQSAATQATNQSSKKQKPSTTVGGESTANPEQPSGPASNQPNAAQSSLAKLASTASTSNTDSQGDYIPCKFTVPELIGLVAPEVASTLTGADEEILKQRVFGAAISQAGDGTQRSTDFDTFVKKLSEDSLSGLTPSQALNHIIQALAGSGSKPVTSADIATFEQSIEAQLSPDTVTVFERFMKSEFDVSKESIPNSQLPSVVPKKFSEWAQKPGETLPSKKQADQITEALSKVQPMDTSSIVDAARNTIGILERPPDIGCAMSILTYDETKQAYGYMIANNYIAVQVVVRNLNRDLAFVLHDVEFEVNTDPTGRLARFFSGRDKVIVRSLSAAQSSFDPRALFVHSSQGIGAILSAIVPIFKAETVTDATAVFNGAFVPGLDKYWKDQTADQLNLLNDTGFSSQASSQTAVPESGTLMFVTFVPSMPFEEGWWTQPCVEKLYLGTTDRLGFVRNLATGAYTRKTTKSSGQLGAAANPRGEQTGVDIARALEVCQLGYDPLPRRRHWKKDYKVVPVATEAPEEASATGNSGGPPDKITQQPPQKDQHGSQIEDQMSQQIKGQKSGKKNPEAQEKPKAANTIPSPAKLEANADLFRNAYHVPYKKWSSNSLALFAELSNTVVSGTHIIEDKKLQPSITAIACSTDDKTGYLIFPTPEKETLSCPLTGKNLDKVAKLRLRNAKDAADTATAEGKVTPTSGDSSGATVEFQTKDLHNLTQPAYSVFAVSSKGVEQRTDLTLHFSTDPSVSGVSPSSIDMSKDHVLLISGKHLALVDKVVLTDPDNKSQKVEISLKQDATNSDAQLSVPLDASTLTVFGTSQIKLAITLGVGSQSYDTTQQFGFIGAATKSTTTEGKSSRKSQSSTTPPKH